MQQIIGKNPVRNLSFGTGNYLEGSINPYFDFSSSSNINGVRFLYRREDGF